MMNFDFEISRLNLYSTASLARTLMARLPRLFRTRFESLTKKKYPIAADIIVFRINLGAFPFYIDDGILCVN